MKWRSSYMVGWAPSFSSSGMLISSMKMAIVSFGLAPNRVFPFLFSFDSIASCVSLGLVLAEKLRKIVITLFSRLLNRKGTASEVLPTPESPVMSMGFLFSSISSKMNLYLRVSMVGTMISWYSQPLGNSNSCSLAYQLMKLNRFSGFTKKSNRV